MTDYIFLTGGVVSSLGKGIVVASIGRMLKSRGLTVSLLKLDPYLNIDPGTMSPYQHGEVFVTVDGAETDLDLGHYERFTDVELTHLSSVTAGQIYRHVINAEREGEYGGHTVQIVPHVTDEIKDRIKKLARETGAKTVVVEVGGTVGDIEGQPFLEAIRQMRKDKETGNVFYVHMTLLPMLAATGELKTKPTQHSVQALRSFGIQPDAIICRSEKEISDDVREKISLYCDVLRDNVISLPDVSNVYTVPLHLEKEGLGDVLASQIDSYSGNPDMTVWERMLKEPKELKRTIEIGIVGKYVQLQDAYLSVSEALRHAAAAIGCRVSIKWVSAEVMEEEENDLLACVSGIIIPGGFDHRGVEGMIKAARYARERNIPYFGLCLGMQVMVIEFARNVAKLANANSLEFDPETPYPVISLMPGQEGREETGGTMRLGSYPCYLRNGSIVHEAYGRRDLVMERHRHRYEVNNAYRDILEERGMNAIGIWREKNLAEIMEIKEHSFMIGTQFHPEFASRPDRPHPLFSEFIRKSLTIFREGGQLPLVDEPQAYGTMEEKRRTSENTYVAYNARME